jgi:hypothetical protein
MINFLLDLISNLIILAVLLTACCVINWMRPDAKADGYLVFVVFVAIALLFDAALTFLVFADSQARYGKFNTIQAFIPRLAAYLTASGIAPSGCRACAAARRPGAPAHAPSSARRLPPIDHDRRWRAQPGICLAHGRAIAYNSR